MSDMTMTAPVRHRIFTMAQVMEDHDGVRAHKYTDADIAEALGLSVADVTYEIEHTDPPLRRGRAS